MVRLGFLRPLAALAVALALAGCGIVSHFETDNGPAGRVKADTKVTPPSLGCQGGACSVRPPK